MSKTKMVICNCDICKEMMDAKTESKRIQVIFTTEQTEGRAVDPYLSDVNIDLCKRCMQILLSGKYIFAHGAQGHNEYYFS